MQPKTTLCGRQFLIGALLIAAGCARPEGGQEMAEEENVIRPGVEMLLADSSHLVRDRAVGLITNHTGIARDGEHTIDLLLSNEVQVVALFGPEHGIRGDVDEGVRVASGVDARTGLPVHSLYGPTLRPSAEMLEGIDVLVFDIQDIGARYYTYVSTMALSMQAAAEKGIPFIVLDRPNPIGGELVQGNVLDPAFATFVGLYPTPMRHGMTVGELARLFNDHFRIGSDLHVVPVAGWTRDLWYDQTGLPWVPTSPNMPDLESATHYPGTCLFEGTNLSVGRGTAEAFQIIGAPWLDGDTLAARLNGYGLPGVRFEAITFTPDDPSDEKFAGEQLNGVRFVTTDRSVYDPTHAAVAALIETRKLAGDNWVWHVRHFDRLAGTALLRPAIDAGLTLEEATAGWDDQIAAFRQLRSKYLLY
ncbi:MAG: DUF1343 domain-containing protein [Gemmatimonadales bacterium]|jgi:uncharacterized protein YbbC (DUF1343 family)